MKTAWSLIALFASTGANHPPARVGLSCFGSNVDPKTYAAYPNQSSTEHWVLDLTTKSIYWRSPYTGKLSWSYNLSVNPTHYNGEAQRGGLVHGWLNEHTYSTITFDRTDGKVVSLMNRTISPKDQPTKLSYDEMAWIGHCVREAPDHREPMKF